MRYVAVADLVLSVTSARRAVASCSERLKLLRSVSVYVGTLDEPSVFQPEAVIFKRDRHDWDVTARALPEFETMQPRSN